MKQRTTRTYSIDDSLFERFEKIISSNKINRSRLIESFIEDFVNITEAQILTQSDTIGKTNKN